MAKKNKSDSTIKFLIYVLLFLIFVLLMLLLFIIPSIKEYKGKKSDFRSFSSQNEHLSKKQVALSQSIAAYKEENSDLLHSFTIDFNETEFVNHAKKYFTNVSLVKGNSKKPQSQFQEYTFQATSHSTTPVDFYTFIDSLESYSSIIKINFPITLNSRDGRIDLDFNMSIYRQNN